MESDALADELAEALIELARDLEVLRQARGLETEAVVLRAEQMRDYAQAAYDNYHRASNKEIVEVHEGRHASAAIVVRLSPKETELLAELAKKNSETMSETLRVGLKALVELDEIEKNLSENAPILKQG